MLGTGNALVTECYNTCFVLSSPKSHLLVDAGGGNGVLSQLEKAQIPFTEIHHLFITHAHTDHLLGCIWIVRMVAQAAAQGKYTGQLHVYSHDKALQVLTDICRMTAACKNCQPVWRFHRLSWGERWRKLAGGGYGNYLFRYSFYQRKAIRLQAILPDGQRLVCLGDEPYKAMNETYAKEADWLLCEAFCLLSRTVKFSNLTKSITALPRMWAKWPKHSVLST